MIVIPMAGASRRFTDAGYLRPKYELMLGDKSVFAHALESFSAYFATETFLFIGGPVPGAATYIARASAELGLANRSIVILEAPTAGQAETVERGLAAERVAPETPITIFNIDTFRRGFRFPDAPWTKTADGWLEVFKGSGANWSYVRPAPGREPRVVETAEKRPISDLCCTGLYHFSRAEDFLWALARERTQPQARELYVAPLYNHLIGQGRCIGYQLIARKEAVFCGTPAEYHALGGGQAD